MQEESMPFFSHFKKLIKYYKLIKFEPLDECRGCNQTLSHVCLHSSTLSQINDCGSKLQYASNFHVTYVTSINTISLFSTFS